MNISAFRAIAAIAIAAMIAAVPAHARFLQADPVGYDGGYNLYAYADDDPVNNVDPDGKKPESVMDQMYLYPQLTPEQREMVSEQHFRIGEAAFNGMISGATGGIALKGGSLLIQGGLRILARSQFGRATTEAAKIASRRGLGNAKASDTGGVKFADGKGNQIRVERGNPKAEHASQRGPYVKETRGGKVRDVNGNEVPETKEFKNPSDNPIAHIPLKEWIKNNK